MEFAQREENKRSWLSFLCAPLLELGYGFTVGVLSNAITLAIALFCALLWILPGHDYFILPFTILSLIVVICLGISQLVGFAGCIVDLCRRHTYQNWIRIALIPVGVLLNFTPFFVFMLFASGGHGIGP